MSDFVTDTHPLIWHLTKDKRLSSQCQEIFSQADVGVNTIWIPAIVLVEMTYLVEKKRFPVELIEQTYALLQPAPRNYRLFPLDLTTLRMLSWIEWSKVPEMPDRIIAASALALGLPLLSRDPEIATVESIEVIWN
jgi:PIN domain nuclease of toxin-antitoxin system